MDTPHALEKVLQERIDPPREGRKDAWPVLLHEAVPDFLVYERVVLEIKAQSALDDVDDAQIINSLKCCRKEVGLLINFGEPSLEWRRFVNTIR